ncbi:unnamed protein product [Ostreobium quekettii]|uniref:Uncharacterized protein n=1 Tax=Ostreobium quekettii TaxID=121088 RepID=A0A8S1JHS8_9CHLO|nr:unnamed protein product [Ostreobium quekettii]|eukprot:evm.model.scf_2345.3 EVM.evm.TU.scf_2345.3   scf_2345:12199-13042(-)
MESAVLSNDMYSAAWSQDSCSASTVSIAVFVARVTALYSLRTTTRTRTTARGIMWRQGIQNWCNRALLQVYKSTALAVVDPIGAVVGGVVFNSYPYVMMGYTAADFVALNYFGQELLHDAESKP